MKGDVYVMTISKRTRKLIVAILLMAMCIMQMSPLALAGFNSGGLDKCSPCAEIEKASQFIISTNVHLNADGGGNVSVWFSVTGTRTMDEIGATHIRLFERSGSTWSLVKTYNLATYTDMLGYNRSFYGSHVTYAGVSGRSYYAVVFLWAGLNGQGDSRERTTSIVVA
jgi:hypothetical protein